MFKWLGQRGIVFWFWVAWIGSFTIGGAIIFGMVLSGQGKLGFGEGPPDLVLTMTATPNPVKAGDNLTYSIRFLNDGEGEASAVALTNPLPSGVSFVSAIPGKPACAESGGIVKCVLGTVAKGSGGTIRIEVKVDPSTTGTIGNTASITSEEEKQEDTDNNTATQSTTVN